MSSSNSIQFLSLFILTIASISSMIPSSSAKSTFPSDVAALKAFKSAIKPSTIPSYSCLGSWNFTYDPCFINPRTYFTCGLLCNGDRITQLTLDSPGYTGSLTPLISQLTQLTNLDLGINKFSGRIPPLHSLANLQTLTLRSNSFAGSLPPSLTLLRSLESLDLSHNFLTGPIPGSISSLGSLRYLDLSYNRLTGSLPNLPLNLISLAAKGNSLSGSLENSTFGRSTQLEVVELSENSFAGAIGAWFFLLPGLQQVDLANNSFTAVEIWKPAGDGYSGLVAVDLGFNRIEGNLPANLAAYPLLLSLSMRYNRLLGPIPGEYGQKETLKRLFLDGNFLNGSPPEGFFKGGALDAGSLGDNCLQICPASSQLCSKSQKPWSICRRAYGGKPRS